MGHSHSQVHKHEGHSHTHTGNKRALTLSFILISSFMIVEFVGGYLTNSLALLSDAGHMLSDAVALGLSLSAVIFGARAATSQKTFGYKRFEILAAMLNGVVLILISIFICKEAIHRLSSPQAVIGQGMMIISVIGLIVNIIVAYILHSQGSTKDNLNIRSAYLHVIGDMLGSVGAIIAAVLILAFDWYLADPIASMIVSVLILYSGWGILRDSINILMEAKPTDINSEEILNTLTSIEGVVEAHDLHIWMITSEFRSMTIHLRVEKEVDRDFILKEAKARLDKDFDLQHVTIQIEGQPLCQPEDICSTR